MYGIRAGFPVRGELLNLEPRGKDQKRNQKKQITGVTRRSLCMAFARGSRYAVNF